MFPFHRLLARLQAQGFNFGVDTVQRLGSYWLLLTETATTDRQAVKWQLATLICKTQEEQSHFYEIFEDTYPAEIELESAEPTTPTPQPPLRPLKKTTEAQTTTPTEPTDRPGETLPPPPAPPPAVSTPSPVLPKLVFPHNPLRVWNLPEMSKALMLHQEKVWAQTSEWDVPATMLKTIRAGGIPQVVFRQRKHAPRYLALIEQKNPRDHLAGFAAELVRELNRRDLEAEFYFYQKTPFRCWKELRDRRTHVFLEYLKSEWSGARLLLLGSAENFVEPFTGQPINLVRDIAEYWSEVALLSITSPLEWGAAEQSLAQLFPVAPASLPGLESLIAQWNRTWHKPLTDWQLIHPEPVPPDLADADDENSLIISVYRYLGKDAFRWACAAAAYPELYFELTAHLHDEAIPTQADLSEWEQNKRWNEALRNLSRLDWFRYGYLPEDIRTNLRNRLSPADLGTVEQELRRILEWSQNAVPPGSYAEEERNRLFEWLSGRTFRVLWIDDHPEHDVGFVAKWTKELGIFFRTARSMAEALEYFEKGEAFDFIISDTGREGEPNTAISTLQTLRTRGISAPVAYFTNRRGLNLRGMLMEAGAMEVTNVARVLEEVLRGKVEEKFNPKPAASGSEPPDNQAETTSQTTTNLPETIQSLLAEGHIEKAIAALKTATPDNSWVVELEERWQKLQREENLGLISNKNAAIARSRLMDDMLGLWEAEQQVPPQAQYIEDEAEKIRQYQIVLQSLGYFKGEADGQMSDEFRQAVISFQRSTGLIADGIIGQQTRAMMLRAMDEMQERFKVRNAVPETWRQLAKSVCQITLPSGNRGTGFLTEGGYIFTANYILPNADAASRANAIFADPEGLAPYYFELDERDFIANEREDGFARVKIKDWDREKTQPFGKLAISTEPPGTSERVSLVFFGVSAEPKQKFLLNEPISSVRQFDILFDAPQTEPGAGGAPIFNERGEVIAIYDFITEAIELRRGILMNEVMWYVNAIQGNHFEFWRGLIERGFPAEALEKMQAEYPDLDELKSYAAEHQKIYAERKEGKLPPEEFERGLNRINYQLNRLIESLESRGIEGSYAA